MRILKSTRQVPVWVGLVCFLAWQGLAFAWWGACRERDERARELYRQLVNAEVLGGPDADERARELGLIRFTFGE